MKGLSEQVTCPSFLGTGIRLGTSGLVNKNFINHSQRISIFTASPHPSSRRAKKRARLTPALIDCIPGEEAPKLMELRAFIQDNIVPAFCLKGSEHVYYITQ